MDQVQAVMKYRLSSWFRTGLIKRSDLSQIRFHDGIVTVRLN
jgi:hypothetical protein